MIIDTFLLCETCGYREVRKAGAFYPAVLPTHCDQLLKSEPLTIDGTPIAIKTTKTQAGKDIILERVGFNCSLVIWYRIIVLEKEHKRAIKRTFFWFSYPQRDAAFEMFEQLKQEETPPLFLEVEQKD